MTEADILEAIDQRGVITWWPGGKSHAAICRLRDRGEVVLEDCSTSQETVFEVRRAGAPNPHHR